MNCATEKGLVIQEIDLKTKANFVKIAPAKRLETMTGVSNCLLPLLKQQLWLLHSVFL